jgi:hypothetical protein
LIVIDEVALERLTLLISRLPTLLGLLFPYSKKIYFRNDISTGNAFGGYTSRALERFEPLRNYRLSNLFNNLYRTSDHGVSNRRQSRVALVCLRNTAKTFVPET